MPAPPFLAESGYAPFSFADDWRELGSADKAPGGADSFSVEKADCLLVGQIDVAKELQARRDILGYAYTDSTYKLKRVNPLRHPKYDDCHATGLSLHRYGIVGNDAYMKPKDAAVRPLGSVPYVAKYQQSEATIRFTQLPYPVVDDSDMTYIIGGSPIPEYYRNVDWSHDVKPDVSTLNAEVDRQLIFCEGYPSTTTPSPASFTGRAVEYICKVALAWRWYSVPEEYLFAGDDGEPVKILNCLGKVNASDFFGYIAGTLLLLGVQLIKFQYPWRFFDPTYPTRSTPAFGYHVTFLISQFDPTPGVSTTTPPGTPLARGHNLFPYRQITTGTSTRWYLATLGGSPTGPRLIPAADYATMFTNVNT